jgi:putative hydrolase of HD superfamily
VAHEAMSGGSIDLQPWCYNHSMYTSQPASPKPDIKRLLELQKLSLALRAVDRMVYIPPGLKVAENNIEHSFSLAMMSWFLAPHFPNLDVSKLTQLCLAHDMLEVYCGDTFSFDDQAVMGQKDREAIAITKLKKEWADFPALNQAIDEFEKGETDEAKFVQALDKLQSALMDYLSEGRAWHTLGITFDKWVATKDKAILISPEVTEYYHQLKDILVKNPQLFPAAQ